MTIQGTVRCHRPHGNSESDNPTRHQIGTRGLLSLNIMSKFRDTFGKIASVLTDEERLRSLADKGYKHARDEVIGEFGAGDHRRVADASSFLQGF
jgi:hypothetical protein